MSTIVADVPDIRNPLPDTIECPLCIGRGELTRTEVLERLGMKDFARVAQLSAEEAIRILLKTEKESEQTRWAKFEVELTKRLAEVNEKHNAELQKLQTEKNEICIRLKEFEKNSATVLDNAKQQEHLATEKQLQKQLMSLTGRIAELEAAQKLAEQQKATEVVRIKAELEAALHTEKAKSNDLDRRVKDFLDEVTKLRERNQELETEMLKVARVGKKEEIDFAEDAHSWPGIWISDKLPRHGDYLLAFRDGAGNALDPKMVVDNKDKTSVTEPDVRKLIRDCKERGLMVGVIVTREETQLRQLDRECRWGQEDGIWLLRSTRAWLQRDLEVLRPIFERMKDLKGKKIGLSKSLNTIKNDWWRINEHMGIESMLRLNDMTIDDVEIVEFPYADDWYDDPRMLEPLINPTDTWATRDLKRDLAFRPLET